MLQIAIAFEKLHSLNIAHRDVKLENILISKDLGVKVIDFGFSVHLLRKDDRLFDFCGTPHYIAP